MLPLILLLAQTLQEPPARPAPPGPHARPADLEVLRRNAFGAGQPVAGTYYYNAGSASAHRGAAGHSGCPSRSRTAGSTDR